MPTRDAETLKEYQKRVIDSVSPSFCAAKWYNATIWLNSGATTSCHHPPAHQVNLEAIKSNPSALHNTTHKKEQRRLMLAGKFPGECDYCWRMEKINPTTVSDRVFKTIIYSDKDIEAIAKADPQNDIDLKTLEIAFDSNCSCGCSYCNASFSSVWANDIKTNGPYQNLVSDGARAFQQDGSWANPYPQKNPYINAFWRWWPSLSKSLTELRITGGEPLLCEETWKLFDFFKINDTKALLFSINSNLCVNTSTIEKLIEYSHHIDHFDIYTSCEATGDLAEYIRDGLNYEHFCRNVDKILSAGKIRTLNFMLTIDSLSLWGVTDFLNYIISIKEKFGANKIFWSINLLRFPSFMSPLALPKHIKHERKIHIDQWHKANHQNHLINEGENESIKRLVNYLETVDAPHRRTSSEDSQHRDFKSFFKQYDQRRNKNHEHIFPETLKEWMRTIPDTDLTQSDLVTGAATDWVLDPEDENPR